MVKNLLITGMPGCGKTSLIKEILREFSIPAYGFFTEEIREGEKRVGFKIVTLSGKIGILAKKGIDSNLRVSQYVAKWGQVLNLEFLKIQDSRPDPDFFLVAKTCFSLLYSLYEKPGQVFTESFL